PDDGRIVRFVSFFFHCVIKYYFTHKGITCFLQRMTEKWTLTAKVFDLRYSCLQTSPEDP
ncbi:MAG: hypothetical protein LKF81_09380, partial [Prevotella sp.]|nr:hypothetical protein [Prevotella sp.]